jgi:hypothetical protein
MAPWACCPCSPVRGIVPMFPCPGPPLVIPGPAPEGRGNRGPPSCPELARPPCQARGPGEPARGPGEPAEALGNLSVAVGDRRACGRWVSDRLTWAALPDCRKLPTVRAVFCSNRRNANPAAPKGLCESDICPHDARPRIGPSVAGSGESCRTCAASLPWVWEQPPAIQSPPGFRGPLKSVGESQGLGPDSGVRESGEVGAWKSRHWCGWSPWPA